MEISGVSSCDVSAILSAGEMDDINKSLEGDLTDFVQIFTHVEAVESLAVAAESTVASPKGNLAETTSTSCLGKPTSAGDVSDSNNSSEGHLAECVQDVTKDETSEPADITSASTSSTNIPITGQTTT